VAPAQVPKGSKGPTAMVFMNMGGPSTTDEVHGFLSALFVCSFRTPIIDCKLTRVGRR
jgi:protoheme ferro-lyase